MNDEESRGDDDDAGGAASSYGSEVKSTDSYRSALRRSASASLNDERSRGEDSKSHVSIRSTDSARRSGQGSSDSDDSDDSDDGSRAPYETSLSSAAIQAAMMAAGGGVSGADAVKPEPQRTTLPPPVASATTSTGSTANSKAALTLSVPSEMPSLVTPLAAARATLSRVARARSRQQAERQKHQMSVIDRRQRRLQMKLTTDPIPNQVGFHYIYFYF